ncbi:MAG: HEAT repeat domain-containing protein [Halobacteriota archaeon]
MLRKPLAKSAITEPLTKALNDADWEVREKVAEALDKIRSRAVQV